MITLLEECGGLGLLSAVGFDYLKGVTYISIDIQRPMIIIRGKIGQLEKITEVAVNCKWKQKFLSRFL